MRDSCQCWPLRARVGWLALSLRLLNLQLELVLKEPSCWTRQQILSRTYTRAQPGTKCGFFWNTGRLRKLCNLKLLSQRCICDGAHATVRRDIRPYPRVYIQVEHSDSGALSVPLVSAGKRLSTHPADSTHSGHNFKSMCRWNLDVCVRVRVGADSVLGHTRYQDGCRRHSRAPFQVASRAFLRSINRIDEADSWQTSARRQWPPPPGRVLRSTWWYCSNIT